MSESIELDLLGTLAHDLKSPLAAMMGYADLIADPSYGPCDELKVEYAQKVRRVGELMLMQINSLVLTCRLDAGAVTWHAEEVDVGALFRDLGDTFGFMAAQGNAELAIELNTAIRIRGDRQRIRLALQNLLANALRHTPAGGRIRLIAEPAANHRVRCSVFNSGSYIDEADRPRLFQKHGRVRGSQEGAGLGLYLARRIVEAHGGRLVLESSRDEGTWFHMDLPSTDEAAPLQTRTGRLMVVGGTAAQAEGIAALLRAEGHEVTRADGCLEAVQSSMTAAPELYVAFVDQPDLPVEELPRSLQTWPALATIPIILLSDAAGPEFAAAVPLDDTVGLRQTAALLLARP